MEIKTSEFFRNMKKLPPEGTEEFKQLIDWEVDKCTGGVTVNGVYFSGWLYWHLNHWWIRVDDVDKWGNDIRKPCLPDLRDNEWIRAEFLEQCRLSRKGYIEVGARQGGKDLLNSSLLYTATGEIEIGSCNVGDRIYDDSGELTTIKAKYPQGIKPVYKITLIDGRELMCGLDHNWFVRDNSRRKLVKKTTREMIKDYLMYRDSWEDRKNPYTFRYSIPTSKPVKYEEKQLPIEPYLLGLWLGDGSNHYSKITTVDKEIEDYIHIYAKNNNLSVTRDGDKTYIINGGDRRKSNKWNNLNTFDLKLKELGLYKAKKIPDIYLKSSVEQRIELLKGLMDTDGSCDITGSIEFSTTDEPLANTFEFLCRSLGIVVKKSTKQGTYRNKKGDKVLCKLVYRYILFTSIPVFKLERKLVNQRCKPKYEKFCSIINIEYMFDAETTCIEVDNKSHLFLTDGFTITHNSEMEASYFGMNSTLFSNTQNVIICGNDNDLSLLKDKVDFGLRHLWKGIAIPRLDKTWRLNQIRLGYKTPEGEDEIWSYIVIRNARDGNVTEVAAGTTAKTFIMDEVGKYPFAATFKAGEPAIKGRNGWRTVPILVGCLTEGNKVFTREGNLVDVKDLQQEDGILGFDKERQEVSPEDILHINPPQEKECYEIITNKGSRIECSYDHPILIKHRNKIETVNGKRRRKLEFIEAANLSKGNLLSLPDVIPLSGEKVMENPYFIGAIIGDGNYSGDRGIRFYNEDQEIWDYIDEIGKDYTIFKSYNTKKGRLYREACFKGGMQQLKDIGIYGQSKGSKDLPKDIHLYREPDVCDLLAGLFDTDGCVVSDGGKNNYIFLSSSSEKLIDSVKILLIRLGIHSNKCFRKPDKRDRKIKGKKGYYELGISDRQSVLRFIEKIHLKINRKQKKLLKLKEIFDKRSSKTDSNYEGLRFEKIKEIRPTGIKPVYNLTTSDTHTYLANGIVTHNTGGSFDNGKDAEDFFYNPESNNFEEIFDEVTGRKTGLFLSGLYRQDCKYVTNLYDWLKNEKGVKIKDGGRELRKIEIHVSDKQKAEEIIQKEREAAKKNPNHTLYLKQVMYYPLNVDECFLTSSENIFDRELIKRQKNRLAQQEYTGTPVILIPDENGKVTHEFTDMKPISHFPLQTGDSKDAPVVIYEFPVENPPYGLYTAGCLLPGEKVVTDRGLKNVENVTLDDKLISKDGNNVDIINLQRYLKKDEDIFTVKLSNSYRRTSFTKEHPIYVSDAYGNNAEPVIEDRFKFEFKEVKDVQVGQWIKVPNIYINENNFDINILWDSTNYRIDRTFNSPLYNVDFWWFIGLFLGDGWCESRNYKITVAFNNREHLHIVKFTEIVQRLFNRSVSKRIRGNSCELSFSCQQLNRFITLHFGKMSYGKHIPDWAKRIPEHLKYQLILGYLDSDGCIYHDKKRNYYSIEFVSINLELIEDVQDILFSLGYISSNTLLREKGRRKISNRTSVTKKTYHLRVGHNETIRFRKNFKNDDSHKLLKINMYNLPITVNSPKKGAFISSCKKYIYFKVKEIETSIYSGWVYNFECETNTFMCKNITTHNCDPYRQGQAKYSSSLGAVYIYKRMHSIVGEGFQDMFVASYVARPDKKDTWNEQARLLIKYYNARTLCENDDISFIEYMKSKGDAHYLEKQPEWLKEITPNTTIKRDYGLPRAAQKVRDFLHTTYKKYMEDVVYKETDEEGNVIREVLGVYKILDPLLLEETIAYDEKGNYDRVVAAELAIAQASKMDPIMGRIQETDARIEALYTRKTKISLFNQPASSFSRRKQKLFPNV